MLRYAARRLLEAIPTTFGVLLLTFVLFHVVGGSPAETVLGKNATAESIAAFNHRYGYDKPLLVNTKPGAPWHDSQFFTFLGGLAKGDFGLSAEYDEPVTDILTRGVGPSLALTVPVLLGGTFAALALSLVCAAFRGKTPDRAVLVLSTALMSVNYVVWVLAGQFLFAFKLRWFPIWGFSGAWCLVLPALIGIVSSLGADVRFFRTAVLDETGRQYVRTARAKGLPPVRILTRHVLRNALVPIVTYVSLSVPFLFTGSLLLESFFGIPGLGNVSINAIHSSDMAVVRAVVVLGALLYQCVNLATDVLCAALDPRVRLA